MASYNSAVLLRDAGDREGAYALFASAFSDPIIRRRDTHVGRVVFARACGELGNLEGSRSGGSFGPRSSSSSSPSLSRSAGHWHSDWRTSTSTTTTTTPGDGESESSSDSESSSPSPRPTESLTQARTRSHSGYFALLCFAFIAFPSETHT